MIGKVLLLAYGAFLLGGVGLYLASRAKDSAARRAQRAKFVSYFCVVNLALLCAFLGTATVTVLVLVVLLMAGYELQRALRPASTIRVSVRAGVGAVYLLASFGLLAFVRTSPPEATVFVYLVVAAFDGFSQVAGQLVGKHAMAPRISPNKTVEGALGGAAAAAAIAVLLRPLVSLTAAESIVACFCIVPAGCVGDLAASWVKRKCGVKDFGSLLPGQGGVLDRFDSLLFAGPASLFLFRLWNS